MKKSLIALAALAATASFAQSSVTLSGNMDVAASNVSGTQSNVKGTTVAQSASTATTSVINIIAVEDLGGGMKATAKYGFDPRATVTDNAGLTRDEAFVGIEGGFGNLRLGSPNSIGLTTFLSASPLGTGIGSGFGATTADYSNIRYNRSARYDSPSFNGFSVAVLYAPGNDQPVAAAPAPAQAIANGRQVTEIGLSYANGPLSVSYANISQAAQTNGTSAAVNIAKTSSNILAASYKLGNTTLSAGWNDGDALFNRTATAGTALKSEGYRVGLRQDIGAIALNVSYADQKTDGVKENVLGLRADYNLSKTAFVYLGYENWDNKKATTAIANTITVSPFPAVNAGDRKIVSMGIRKSF